MYFLGELNCFLETILNVELKSGNHRWNIVPFVRLVLKLGIDKSILDFLLLPLIDKSLERLPLMHHSL